MARLSRTVGALAVATVELPPPLCGFILGGLVLGALGGVAGLLVGLGSHPPTAWFAVIELGLPAAVLGTVLGLAAGSLVWAVRAVVRRHG